MCLCYNMNVASLVKGSILDVSAYMYHLAMPYTACGECESVVMHCMTALAWYASWGTAHAI